MLIMHLHELPVCHLCCLTFIFNLMCTTRLNNHFHLAVALKRQRQAGEGNPGLLSHTHSFVHSTTVTVTLLTGTARRRLSSFRSFPVNTTQPLESLLTLPLGCVPSRRPERPWLSHFRRWWESAGCLSCQVEQTFAPPLLGVFCAFCFLKLRS